MPLTALQSSASTAVCCA
jgi:hypothetical protein